MYEIWDENKYYIEKSVILSACAPLCYSLLLLGNNIHHIMGYMDKLEHETTWINGVDRQL